MTSISKKVYHDKLSDIAKKYSNTYIGLLKEARWYKVKNMY